MAVLGFDDEETRRLTRVYTTPDVVTQRAEILRRLDPRTGERILDVGSGPGLLAASMADAVGPDGAVVGIDPSAAMNAVAAQQAAEGRPWVRIDEGDATALPLEDDTADAATVVQVYEYVDDLPAALAELHRVLRPGGRVVVVDTDWDSAVWHTADRDLHRRVMTAWDEHLVHPHLPDVLPGHLRRGGFDIVDRSPSPMFNATHDPDTFSVGMIDMIAAFVIGRHGLTADDVDAWRADLAARGADDEYLFSLTRFCFTAVAR